jgi:hypothetical protein
MHIKDAQEQIAALQASESIKHANLQELARLVLDYADAIDCLAEGEASIEMCAACDKAERDMIGFAKGVAQ